MKRNIVIDNVIGNYLTKPHDKQPNFQPAGIIDQPGSRWLFRAAVGQVAFLLEVLMNLKPPLNALLNRRPGKS
jgi:hypothetical protein